MGQLSSLIMVQSINHFIEISAFSSNSIVIVTTVTTEHMLKLPTYLNHPKVYMQRGSHDANISVTKCFPKFSMDMLYLIRGNKVKFV